LVTVIVTIVTEVGKRKPEDTGALENILILNKSDRKCKKYQILGKEFNLSGCQ